VIELMLAEGRPVYLIRADRREVERLGNQYRLVTVVPVQGDLLKVDGRLGAPG